MSTTGRTGLEISGNSSSRSLSEMSVLNTIRLGVDIVSAARRNIGLLRTVAESPWLHQTPALVEAVRRYDELWMPLVSDLTVVSSALPMILPPIDVQWVWFCHSLNPVSYRQYCETKFSKLIGRLPIFDEENEEYALMRCREKWIGRYPSETFENEADLNDLEPTSIVINEDVYGQVTKQRQLFAKFSEPYMSEIVYLLAARQRYKAFLYMLQNCRDVVSCRLVPTVDIMLLWLTHQSYPTVYAEDLKELEDDIRKVVAPWETTESKEFKETKNLWERTFDQPYEKTGGGIAFELRGVASSNSPIYWEESETDVNSKYKSMMPRFLLEVCVFVRLKSKMKAIEHHINRNFLCLHMVKCHSELKLDQQISSFSYDSWCKAWHLYCEFGSKGVIIQSRQHGANCYKGSSLLGSAAFHWNDMMRAPSLSMRMDVGQQVTIVASITPPVQAPYLLKCVPDRVTDDSGAMISDVILKMNRYRPQQGRWLSRTVLDHAGRECFVIRIRIGGGFWRRGGETPSTVKWEDRIIEIREGSWSYVAGSIGKAPDKVVATATPKQPTEHWNAAWTFSTGDGLLICWESLSSSIPGLSFCFKSQESAEPSVKLLKGRQMQYQVRKSQSKIKIENFEYRGEKIIEEEEDDEGFVTLVRFTDENPAGKATALLNWKLLVVELSPEEDAVLMLLLCVSILRSESEMVKEDVGGLLNRRRFKEAKIGARDWGSVILHPSSWPSSITSPYLQPWYWNARTAMASDETAHLTKQPALTYSAAEGSDKLYKQGIIN